MDMCWNLLGCWDAKDLRTQDLIVPLTSHPDSDGNVLLYVGKDGEGEIVKFDHAAFQAAQSEGFQNLVSVLDLSPQGIMALQKKIAVDAAGTVLSAMHSENAKVFRLPFHPEDPGTASANDLKDIRSILAAQRDEIGSNLDRPIGARHSDVERQASYEGGAAVLAHITDTVKQIDFALELPTYANDIRQDTENSKDLDAGQKQVLGNILNGVPDQRASLDPIQQPVS